MNYITYEELHRINLVQIEILKAVDSVCRQLNITYFMVHGSLLGTIRNKGFIYGDDDIDIAIPRKMYEVFLEKAPELLPDGYFVQCVNSDPNYPLEFAKIRDSRTTYIVDNARKIEMNHGIYIDLFPIDNSYTSTFQVKLLKYKRKLINYRLSDYEFENRVLIKKMVKAIAYAIYPTKKIAMQRRKDLFESIPQSEYVGITGGKTFEQHIPSSWFETVSTGTFENINVFIPEKYNEYLSCIYGDFMNRTLIEGKTDENGKIEINATVVSAEKPFTYFMKS